MASLRRIVSSLLLPLALGAASEPLRAVTRPQRIFTPISDGQRSEIVDSANPRALAARDLGAASGDKVLPAITLRFSMTAAQKADLDQLLADQQNPNSPLYRQWLTPESFGERFGMNDNDLAKVQAWAVSQGFKVSAVARAKNFLTLSGTVAQAQRAFGTQIDSVTLDGEEHIANVTNITLPSALASTVGVVTGLDDIRPKPRTTPIVQPNFNTGSGSHFLVPADYQKIYDVQSILSTVDGTGVTIAIVGQATVDLTNVTNFRSLSGLPAKTVTVKTYTAPTAGSNSDDAFESYLDLEWPGATAPNANLIFATSDNAIYSLFDAIDDDLAPIISISYGLCEKSLISSNSAVYLDQYLAQANALGITVVSSSGDSGATDCETHGSSGSASATTGLSVDMPTSSPHATSVGGTMFNDRVSPSTYWSASNGANYASVLSYIPEVAWNENGSSDCSGGCGILSTGGGVSAVFAKPVWQTGLGVPADGRRDVPDVALTAAAHDAYLLCTPGFCSNGFASSSGSVSGVAGTSASAPAFAGMLALVIQKTGANIGNANPYLYALANSAYAANVYHDITSGDNKVPCTAGSTNCPSGGSIGYTAGVGYDPVTGLGSVVASQLVTHWGQVVPVGTPGTLATTATLTATSLTGVVGGSDSFTITIGPSAPNVVAPTGSVSYIVNGTNYAYQALTSSGTNGTSSITFTMNAASYFHAGQNTVQVLYLGDATYASSQSNILTINLATQGTTLGNFTMTASQSAVTVAAGATTPPVTMTLTSTGYTGALNFSVTNPEMTLNACYTFTPTSVTLASSTATATAIFSLSTSCSSSNSTPVSGSGQNLIQSASNAPQHAPGYAAGAAVLLSVLLFFGLPRRRRWAPLLAVLLALASFGINGCGSGGSSVAGSGSGTIISSRGIYTIVLTATGTGNVTQSASFKLTVQ